jgi:hypothetical protein
VNDARVRHTSGDLLLDAAHLRVAVRVEGYQVWDAGGDGGPFYLLRTLDTPEGRRSQALLVTSRRVPVQRKQPPRP